jgi:CBS domain containing-hemolysin-like protein
MYGEHAMAEWLAPFFERLGVGRWVAAHTVATVAAVTALTYLHIVLGEMVPKSIALQRAERVALWIVPVMRAVQVPLFPLVIALNGIGAGVLRVFGIRRERTNRDQYRTPAEIAYLVRETVAGGLLRQESANVVQELLEFSGLTAGQVMVPRVRVAGIPAGAGLDEISRALASRAHTRYPVYEDTIDRITGAVHVKDLLRCLAAGAPLPADAVRAVPMVPESAELDAVLAQMNATRSQLAVVVDEHGGTAGIVTVEDLFEEVVGEFGEDARDVRELSMQAEGRLRARGTARLTDVGAAFDLVLEHDEVETVSGLVLSALGRPPVAGDAVRYGGLRFDVVRVEGKGVGEVTVSRAP